jgi:hypothetical protein
MAPSSPLALSLQLYKTPRGTVVCTTSGQALGFSTCLSRQNCGPPPVSWERQRRIQSEMPPYLVPPSPSRRDEGTKKQFPSRGAASSGQNNQTSVPEAGTQRRYLDLCPLQEVGRAMPSATAQRCLSMDGYLIKSEWPRDAGSGRESHPKLPAPST